ncbi:MAG: hypothetical protein A2052_02150 [Deltaproteobacteria bacterium GWA2_54_12]|nr:MAG: hypothetical protein A2052_02150 [Deltaproteobacteria bacterium GWA2_54_12]
MMRIAGFLANSARNNRSLCPPRRAFTLVLAVSVLLSAASPLLTLEKARAARDSSEGQLPTLELRVDPRNHARVFCNGVKLLVSIGGFFEFYERSLTGGRKRILSGPWGGSLRENSPGTHSLIGNDPASGAEYTIVFRQTDARTIEFLMTFKTPSRPSNLDIDIVKLSSDFFKGGTLDASPAALNDAKGVPVEPRSLAARMLLAGKNQVLVRGSLCDVEIEEMTDMNSMYAADGRNIPWDKFRSIIIGAEYSNLSPGKHYSFKYSIRCLPPSLTEMTQEARVSSRQTVEFNEWSFFSIPPKEESAKEGFYQLQKDDHIYGSPSGTAEAVLAKEIAKLTSMHLDVKPPGLAAPGRGLIIERIPAGARPDMPPEGFEIVVSPDKVIVRGADERGCLYGVYALLGRLEQKAGAWEINSGLIKDWPDLSLRGGCLEILSPVIRDVGVMKRYLDAFSRARSNVVIFLHTPQQIRSWRRDVDDGNWTKKQMAEIARYARSLHMDVWGGVGSGFNRAEFLEMDIHQGSNFYNPFIEKNYQFLFSLYEEILKTYEPATLLISHDEIQGLSVYAAESGKTTAEILAMDIRQIHDWLNRRNVRTAMWGDMLLDHDRWEAEVGSANSQNLFFRSGATHLALQQIPMDVLILDWHYDEKKSYDSIGHFRRNGFRVVGVPWHEPKVARNMAGSVKHSGGQGIIAADWGFWRTMSPAATTLYAPLCGWSVQCRIGDGNSDVVAFAKTVRDPVYAGNSLKQIPVSLHESSNRPIRDLSGGNNKALFGVGPVLDLRGFQPGKQILGGILFDVLPDDGGRRNNSVVVSNTGSYLTGEPKEKTLFTGNEAVRQIAFLHTSFVEEPNARVRKLGWYLVEYDDGGLEAVDLLENWNITDIRSSEGLRHNDWTFLRSPEVLIGAKQVWTGSSASGVPLNLQLFVWTNPYPGKRINSIKLIAADEPEGTKLALLGLTFLHE